MIGTITDIALKIGLGLIIGSLAILGGMGIEWAMVAVCCSFLVGLFAASIWWQNYVHERRMRFYRARGFMSRKITELEIKLNDAVALNHQLRFRCFDLERERSEHSAPSVSPQSNV